MTPAERITALRDLVDQWTLRGQEGTRSTVEEVTVTPEANAYYQCAVELDALLVGPQEPDRTAQVESLSEYAHNAWSGWMRYLWSKRSPKMNSTGIYLPAEWCQRWERQMQTPYAELREDEKESDRTEARTILALLDALIVGETPTPKGPDDAT